MPLKGVSTEEEVTIGRMDEVVDFLVDAQDQGRVRRVGHRAADRQGADRTVPRRQGTR